MYNFFISIIFIKTFYKNFRAQNIRNKKIKIKAFHFRTLIVHKVINFSRKSSFIARNLAARLTIVLKSLTSIVNISTLLEKFPGRNAMWNESDKFN